MHTHDGCQELNVFCGCCEWVCGDDVTSGLTEYFTGGFVFEDDANGGTGLLCGGVCPKASIGG